MSPRLAKLLAGTAWAVSIGLVLGALVFAVQARSYTGVGQPLLLRVLLWLPALLAFPTVGVLVARRLPEHAVGWLFLGIGLLNGVGTFAEGYGTYALALMPGSLPAAEFIAWLPAGCTRWARAACCLHCCSFPVADFRLHAGGRWPGS